MHAHVCTHTCTCTKTPVRMHTSELACINGCSDTEHTQMHAVTWLASMNSCTRVTLAHADTFWLTQPPVAHLCQYFHSFVPSSYIMRTHLHSFMRTSIRWRLAQARAYINSYQPGVHEAHRSHILHACLLGSCSALKHNMCASPP